jgi:DNA-directed RNA polymerase subunit RPC12/RpoP
MTEDFIDMRYRTTCYNCGKLADQEITASSSRAEVVCSNCGATRIFVPRFEDPADTGEFAPIECYDVWDLQTDATCKNCHVNGPHQLIIGCRNFSTHCNNCDYTHFYRFDMEYIPDRDGPAEIK